MLALLEAGIACEEVPGISSAIAAPAAAGIPVTHRGLSRSVTVLTASSLTEGEERMTEADYGALARLSGTLVILMGMHHLKELTDRLIGAGMPPSRPAAVVMEGATERQKWVRAPLKRLAEEAERAGLKAPAVIVIGETAALHLAPMDISGTNDRPSGPSPQETFPQGILLQETFPQGAADRQASGPLRSTGATPLRMTVMRRGEIPASVRFSAAAGLTAIIRSA